jgi:quercetin 2,3-dioxygenase
MAIQNRRSFFKYLGSGLVASTNLSKLSLTNKKLMNKQIVLEVKPMGFIWETLDPFLFCVHHEDKFPIGNEFMGPDPAHFDGRSIGDDFIIKDGWRMYHGKTVPGFPGHPHRGFETITIVRDGIVDHADSLGASGRYGEGDVQWMTAGKGVQHSEMFPLLYKDKENPLELFQIWINLPAKNKMVEPHFKMLWGNSIPKLDLKDENNNNSVFVELIAGNLAGFKAPSPPPNSWAADPNNEVCILNIKLAPHTKFTLDKASEGINRVLYFYEGDALNIDKKVIPHYSSVKVDASQDLEIKNGNQQAKILVLQGKPIDETVIQYGPFVMNSKDEIQQAFNDYHATKFGGWPWPKYDQVHDRNLGRFAKHADGTIEQGT